VEWSVRVSCTLALAFLVAGCTEGDISNTDAGRIGELVFHELSNIGSSGGVPRERVAAIPYATLGVRLGSSDESMFVLSSKTGNDLHWLGGAELAITVRLGRIVQTVGFKHNLTGFQGSPAIAAEPAEGTVSYLYDFAERSRYGVAVACTRHRLGKERLVILGVPHDASHVAEDCAVPQLDWRFRNEFWIDGSGFVWRSQQYVDPDMDMFTLEILRPAG